jgi:hypothetical protein
MLDDANPKGSHSLGAGDLCITAAPCLPVPCQESPEHNRCGWGLSRTTTMLHAETSLVTQLTLRVWNTKGAHLVSRARIRAH